MILVAENGLTGAIRVDARALRQLRCGCRQPINGQQNAAQG